MGPQEREECVCEDRERSCRSVRWTVVQYPHPTPPALSLFALCLWKVLINVGWVWTWNRGPFFQSRHAARIERWKSGQGGRTHAPPDSAVTQTSEGQISLGGGKSVRRYCSSWRKERGAFLLIYLFVYLNLKTGTFCCASYYTDFAPYSEESVKFIAVEWFKTYNFQRCIRRNIANCVCVWGGVLLQISHLKWFPSCTAKTNGKDKINKVQRGN